MVGRWFIQGRQRRVERRDHAVGYNMSPSIFVRELGRWYNKVLIRSPVEQILAPVQADEVTEQAMLLPEKSAVRLEIARIEAVFIDR
jgi:hypothetical protein